MRHELKKFLHLLAWLAAGFLLFLGVAALCGCGLYRFVTGDGSADEAEQSVRHGTVALQGVAALFGAPWAIPIIGAGGAALAGVLHAQVGIPGVKAIPGTRAHRKRAVRAIQKQAASVAPQAGG
jgi:hypothetical protein